jgi:hypothetical protein
MNAPDFTVGDLLAWARTQPADKIYHFCNPYHCAVAQFGRATGREYLVSVGDLRSLAPLRPAMAAICLSMTFGELVRSLEHVVEPSRVKRIWARLTGKTIGPETFTVAVSGTWTKARAYLAEIEELETA